jgi:hypothetical protein
LWWKRKESEQPTENTEDAEVKNQMHPDAPFRPESFFRIPNCFDACRIYLGLLYFRVFCVF